MREQRDRMKPRSECTTSSFPASFRAIAGFGLLLLTLCAVTVSAMTCSGYSGESKPIQFTRGRAITAVATAEPLPTKALEAASAKGRKFLSGLFDPALGLLPEYRGAKVYWLYHDNYLAAKVLDRTEPELAKWNH